MTEKEDLRVHCYNDCTPDSRRSYVLYWMQSAQRAADNAALHQAILRANQSSVPVLALFVVAADYPEANQRHMAFMLQGLAETREALAELGVKLVGHIGHPPDVVVRYASDATEIMTDVGYLRHLRQWRKEVGRRVTVRMQGIECDVVVPVRLASDNAEHAARTLRPKIERYRDRCLQVVPPLEVSVSSLPLHITGDIDFSAPGQLLTSLDCDASVKPTTRFIGGTGEARRRLSRFLRQHLPGYAERRNDPASRSTSELSPYLHFGQIGVAEVASKVLKSKRAGDKDKEAYLEELIVRRELAVNFVWYTKDYDRFACLPAWARKTLDEHRNDERPARYTRSELEAGHTNDRYWNAAMREMRCTGYMHNYMRMYWGKKVLEWCNTPDYAYRTLLYLNNRWFIDGRDANSYANVGWIFGLHDRGWTERAVFGKVRYMNANGLERKFDIDRYVEWTETLTE